MAKQWQGDVTVERVRAVLEAVGIEPKGLRQCDGPYDDNPEAVEIEVPEIATKRDALAALQAAGLAVVNMSASFVTVARSGPRGPL